jgi:hypothetical protein
MTDNEVAAAQAVASIHEEEIKTMADKKLFFCFRGPYECSAWAKPMTREEALEYVGNDVVSPVLAAQPDLQSFRIEHHRGEADEDGRVFVWGEDEPSSGDGPDTQHEGYEVWVNGEHVFSNCRFVDSEDTEHDPEDCEICAQPD